jgi:hypothetical protein
VDRRRTLSAARSAWLLEPQIGNSVAAIHGRRHDGPVNPESDTVTLICAPQLMITGEATAARIGGYPRTKRRSAATVGNGNLRMSPTPATATKRERPGASAIVAWTPTAVADAEVRQASSLAIRSRC